MKYILLSWVYRKLDLLARYTVKAIGTNLAIVFGK
jgi:hypothetical protein